MVKNLLSICMRMAMNDFCLEFHSSSCLLRNAQSSQVLAKGVLKNGLYEFSMTTKQSTQSGLVSNSAKVMISSSAETHLWHSRLGHVNLQKLKTISNSTLYSPTVEFTTTNKFFCESCVYGKHHVLPYALTGTTKATKPLELVHSDLCGPMSTLSMGGVAYFLTFIDDWSKYTVAYYLKHKDETFSCFVDYFQLAER